MQNEWRTIDATGVATIEIVPFAPDVRFQISIPLPPVAASISASNTVATTNLECVIDQLFTDHQVYWQIGATQNYDPASSVVLGRGQEPDTGTGLMKLTVFP